MGYDTDKLYGKFDDVIKVSDADKLFTYDFENVAHWDGSLTN